MMRLTNEILSEVAIEVGVCCRPYVRKVTDRANGAITAVPLPCGTTRESVCKPCAQTARRLRMQQCTEGWHLTEDPFTDGEQETPIHEAPSSRASSSRRCRSTQRPPGIAPLPNRPVDPTTIGRTFTDQATGRTFRPSMFLTLTLPSYGPVVPGVGVPRNRSGYDYRRAALDALFFPRLVDRFWQNLRRAAGYRAQYFSVVEAQRRLAPHLHAAVRGAIPREVIRQTATSTYCAIWWPSISRVEYDESRGDAMPVWEPAVHGYVDPKTGEVLPSWDEALAKIDADPDAAPFHLMVFGSQVDIQGIIGDHQQTRRAIGYLCKYLTKSIAETYDQTCENKAYQAHIWRLHQELRWLPCSETCANWIRFGVTPKDPSPGLAPGECEAKAHSRECLGIGGRRVLVSRHWTGKTLTDHRADRAEVVRQVLESAGLEAPNARRLAADVLAEDGQPRFVWEDIEPEHRDYQRAIASAIRQKRLWQQQYRLARERSPSLVENPFGNQFPDRPDSQPKTVSAATVKGDRRSSRSDRRPLSVGAQTEQSQGGRPALSQRHREDR